MGLSQSILAARAGISLRALQRLEREQTANPSARVIKALCQELGADAGDLFGWQPEVDEPVVTVALPLYDTTVGDPVPPALAPTPPGPSQPGGEVPLRYR